MGQLRGKKAWDDDQVLQYMTESIQIPIESCYH